MPPTVAVSDKTRAALGITNLPARSTEKMPVVDKTRTKLSSRQEQHFQLWYKFWSEVAGLDPNPDAPLHYYDYRGAFKAKVEPEIDPANGQYHWDSRFKDDDHPNRFIDGVDTKTGRPVGGELFSREEFGRRAPGEVLPGDEQKRGEMSLTPENVLVAGTLLKRVANVSPNAMKFLRRVFSGKTAEMLKEMVPSAKLEGGTLIYHQDEIPQLAEAMRKLGAPRGLTLEREFEVESKNQTRRSLKARVRTAEQDIKRAERLARAVELPITSSGAGGPIIREKGFPSEHYIRTQRGQVLGNETFDSDYDKANEWYINWLQKNNPLFFQQLIREQGEIARTQPFRPGPLLPFEEGGPAPELYPGEARVPSRPVK